MSDRYRAWGYRRSIWRKAREHCLTVGLALACDAVFENGAAAFARIENLSGSLCHDELLGVLKETAVARNPRPPIERIARALCRHAGHGENITMDGAPMWHSFEDEARELLAAADVSLLLDALTNVAKDQTLPPKVREEAETSMRRYQGIIV